MTEDQWLIHALRDEVKRLNREIDRLHGVIAARFEQGALSAMIGRVASFSDKSWKG